MAHFERTDMGEIDPQVFGQLTAKVDNLEKTLEKMSAQVDTLMAIVNQGRGAFWLAVLVGGAISSIVTFLATKIGLGNVIR
jgi:hypothetical protein